MALIALVCLDFGMRQLVERLALVALLLAVASGIVDC